MNWQALRQGLIDARNSVKLTVPQLALAMNVNKTTLYAIEKHEQQPGLDTIAKWLSATTCEPVSAFLARYDGSALKTSAQPQKMTSADTVDVDTTGSSSQSPSESGIHGSASDQARAVLAALSKIDSADILERVAAAIGDAVAALRSDSAVRSRDVGTARSSAEDPGVGRPRAANVQRLKKKRQAR